VIVHASGEVGSAGPGGVIELWLADDRPPTPQPREPGIWSSLLMAAVVIALVGVVVVSAVVGFVSIARRLLGL
jgi:hypothetical protein